MNKLKVWLILGLIISFLTIGCTTTRYVYEGPLPAKRPTLKSIVFDRNDKTKELGMWMDFNDIRSLTVYAEYNEGIRDELSRTKENK